MSLVVWSIIAVVVVATAYYATRMSKDREALDRHDAGLAIIEFGRAYPTEAIRSLHVTESGDACFVRLFENKAGFMRNYGAHYACHLIEPGRVRVQPLGNGRGFQVEFLDAPTQSGAYVFSTAAEAAEVSLWLLGNYVGPDDRHLLGGAHTEIGDGRS
ncbi:hypothetical protein [Rhizobium sp. SSA_523]|uniref:hypothetical protein n=1 Tax=Rhizobium sp. SSA_523 TaxID=2952477 RepID=UPI002091AB6E|nr:hypothetical protein [Rhizobium sp. SSA_523]MCO5734060.1 hypothetical protein [Rhizobium sp. SSA_523]WKC24698.1 hypothetical protein QTJ18_11750 [Rhizobium sp. SSA_523]